MSTDKRQILEPITTISKLIMLTFKQKNTKIAIRDHNIVFCEAETNYFGLKQSFDRYLNGDSREDIYILNHVICNFIDWYILPYKTNDSVIYNSLINMSKYLIVGLKELQSTYKQGNAVGTLQYYINILYSIVNNTFEHDMLYNNKVSERTSFLDDDNNDNRDLFYSTIFDIQKFQSFWSKDELKRLINQFDNCFKNANEQDNYIFMDPNKNDNNDKQINNKNDNNDKQINNKNMITNKLELPIPRSQKNPLVNGYLVGIEHILNIMDTKFTKILDQSVKGAQ